MPDLNYDTSASALAMAQTIFGNGVQVQGASYTGAGGSSAIYTGGDTISPGVTPGDTGIILSTGRARDFTNATGQTNQSGSTSTNTSGPNNQADFNALAGRTTFDASYLDVVFVPDGDLLTMQFVFSSDEYPEFSNSIYNDTVGVWINGSSVPLAVGDGVAAVGNINQNENTNLYVNNTSDQFNTEMDGFTVTMTLTIPVVAGEENEIRIGIADTSDSSYDSNLLIAGGSVQTRLVALEDEITIFQDGTRSVDLLANDVNATGGRLEITHINGETVRAGDTVTLATGQEITLNADGTVTIETDDDEELINFTYEVAALDSGDNVIETDIGFVSLDTIPCFVSGTNVETPEGPVAVEDLVPGDMVLTLDDGPQPLRWSGRRRVEARGDMAPISIGAGTFGDHGEVLVSPLHRVLVRDQRAELMFGEAEVLVAARDLIDDRAIRRRSGGSVEYVHLMFDRHQILISDGLPTESFFPGTQTTSSFEAEALAELRGIFPEIDLATGEGYSEAARPMLRRFEGELLGGASS